MRLKLASAASRSRPCSKPGAITASVAMKPSIVAMLGLIMPAPLLTPVTVTVRPPICNWRDAALGRVSVVMMPWAAANHRSDCRSAIAPGRPASMRSTGSVSMITPVEKGSTWAGARPISAASAAQVLRARSTPSAPVPALALPVLTTSARMPAPLSRCSRQTWTGAAQKRLVVKTPATLDPGASASTTRSSRLGLRMPARATPRRTPATACKLAGSGDNRLTGMQTSAL